MLLLVAPPAGPVLAAERSYRVDHARTTVQFTVDATGFAGTTGTMPVRQGVLRLDVGQPEQATMTLSLDAAAIDTGLDARDAAIRGTSFLDVARFPEISFTTRVVYPAGERRATVLGDLTMIGTTRPLAIDTELTGPITPDETVTFAGTARLARSDWGMTGFLPLVGDDVRITFQVTAEPSP